MVTAFLIESYKFLQPDPNDAVIGLLFHIASGLNNSSPFPPSVNPASITTPFSQTSSSIRINVFWFISLILSLTSVLVGTISLQWLREHQSYTGFSSKEKLAIFHMRSEALEVWYVPQIFAVLPVLLQGAVALFLVGLIEFALPLGREITISASATIGVTLLFLAATTILPTCQVLLFFTGIYPYSKPPTPCAFKSPQSRFVWTIFAPLLLLFTYLLSIIYWIIEDFFYYPLLRRHVMLPHLRIVLRQKTWPVLDHKWLTLRDAYHQCIVDKDIFLYPHQKAWKPSFPLNDITQFLVNAVKETATAKHTDTFLGAAVHCFQDISASIWTDSPLGPHFRYFERRDRRSNYFEQFYLPQYYCSMSRYLLHGGARQYRQLDHSEVSKYIEQKIPSHLLHQDQIHSFLVILLQTHKLPALHLYQMELWSQLISEIHNIAPFTPTVDHSFSSPGNDSASNIPSFLNADHIQPISTNTCKPFY